MNNFRVEFPIRKGDGRTKNIWLLVGREDNESFNKRLLVDLTGYSLHNLLNGGNTIDMNILKDRIIDQEEKDIQ